MNLYEFTFIAQQGLLQQEVEGMVQELAVLLKNIKAEVIFQEAKSLIGETNNKLAKQELETYSRKIQEILFVYSDILENVVKSLWIELEADLSNLKGVKAKIEKEVQNTLPFKELGVPQKEFTKSSFIYNTINALKESISENILKNSKNILKNFEDLFEDQFSRILEKLLRNIEASGLIKYEHWGLLDFAYPINKMKGGHYCILCISSTPGIMDEFARKVKLNESIIRYLSIQVDKVFEGKSYMMNKQIEEQGI